jgi:hypothetical protein
MDSLNRRFMVILLSRGVRSSKILATSHQTTRRHLNIHFGEDLHCSFLLRRDTFRGRHILKQEFGWGFAGYLFRWLWDLVWIVWNMRVRNAELWIEVPSIAVKIYRVNEGRKVLRNACTFLYVQAVRRTQPVAKTIRRRC